MEGGSTHEARERSRGAENIKISLPIGVNIFIQLYERLLLEVKDRMENGKGIPECFAARLWESNDVANIDRETLAYRKFSALILHSYSEPTYTNFKLQDPPLRRERIRRQILCYGFL